MDNFNLGLLMSDLSKWLTESIERRGLTLNATAVYSGVSAATLSEMINKDHIPRVELLFKLADYFDTPRNDVLMLAGYLEQEDENSVDPDLQRIADNLIALWREVRELDPDAAERLTGIAVLQAEMVLAAARSKAKRQEREKESASS